MFGVENEEILAHLMLIEQMLDTIGHKMGVEFEIDLIRKALVGNFEEILKQKQE